MTNEAKSSSPPCSSRDDGIAAGWPAWLRVALIGRRPKFTVVRVVVLIVVAFVAFGFILLPVRIQGPSMLPNYRNGGFNMVNRLAYLRHEPRRGDVVAIRISGTEYSAGELVHDLTHVRLEWGRVFRPSMMYMKRIVGLPGETITFSGGQLFVDGKPLDEPYLNSSYDWEHPPQKLGPRQYFVVGDNRTMRINDHTFGAADRARLVGKVML